MAAGDNLPPLHEDADKNIGAISEKKDMVQVNRKERPPRTKQTSTSVTINTVTSTPAAEPEPVSTKPTTTASNFTQFSNDTGSRNSTLVSPEVALAQLELEKTILANQIAKEQEHWIRAYWRPAMGWLYMIICFMDFVGFPMLTMFLPAILQHWGITITYKEWESLTLSNGGLIHLAFGAILGVAAWTRGTEKVESIRQTR